MKKDLLKKCVIILCALTMIFVTGCGKKEETEKAELPQDQVQQDTQTATTPAVQAPFEKPQEPVVVPEAKDSSKVQPQGIAVSVDGVVLTKEALDQKTKEAMEVIKGRYPEEKKQEVYTGMRKRIVDDFVIRTLLVNEVNHKKITISEKEIQEEIQKIKAGLPADKKVEEFMKENRIDKNDLALGIKIKKLVDKETGGNVTPTEQDVSKFYTDNKDKFVQEETAHVRHVLLTIDANDDDKKKAEKKARIESLRKQILGGADFAEIARKNSDCPSKESGGDIGDVKRGQTVKPFEDAAFSQDINAVGPVVATEFGYHVIQVLGKKPAKTTKFEDVKDKIAMHLEQTRNRDAFGKLMERLKKKAVILSYEK